MLRHGRETTITLHEVNWISKETGSSRKMEARLSLGWPPISYSSPGSVKSCVTEQEQVAWHEVARETRKRLLAVIPPKAAFSW